MSDFRDTRRELWDAMRSRPLTDSEMVSAVSAGYMLAVDMHELQPGYWGSNSYDPKEMQSQFQNAMLLQVWFAIRGR